MSESRKVEITSLKLKLGRTEATLTIDEAKKLKKILEEIFGVKEVEVIRDRVVPSFPVIIEKEIPYWDYPRPIWYGGTTGTPMFEMQNNNQILCSIK